MENGEIEALMQSGAAHYQAKDFNAAIADFTEVIESNPNNATVWYNRGCAWYGKGSRTRALADWEQAAALMPDNVRYQEMLKKARGAAGSGKPASSANAVVQNKTAGEAAKKIEPVSAEQGNNDVRKMPAQMRDDAPQEPAQPKESETTHDKQVKTYKKGDIGPSGGVILCDASDYVGDWQFLPVQIFEAAPAEYEFNASLEEVFSGKKCEKLKINGLTGWHPPYLQHLTWMYENLYKKGLGNFEKDGIYWSAAKVAYKECTLLDKCSISINCPAGKMARGIRDPDAYHRYNEGKTCNDIGYQMDFMDGNLYTVLAKAGRNLGKPVINKIRLVREVTDKDAEIPPADKGKNYNPYKAKKSTMIGLGIAAVILGVTFVASGGNLIGFIGIIVGIVVLVKGIKF